MLDRRQIGERIAERRETLNLTQGQLAQRLGISRPRLSGIERGLRPLDAAVLSRLAHTLNVTAGYLVGLAEPAASQPPEKDKPVVRFRAQLADVQREAELAGVLRFIDRFHRLVSWAGEELPQPDLPQMRYASNLRHYASEGDASRLRHAWGLGDVPIGLDIFELLEERGISVYREALPRDEDDPDWVSGAYVNDPVVGPVLFVNSWEWPYRQVFTAAHELAHLIYSQVSGFSVNRSKENEERLCNRFASAFLMPEAAIDAHLSRRETRRDRIKVDDVLSLHRTFGVSFGAMLVRLKALGILKSDSYDDLKNTRPVHQAVHSGYVVEPWEYGYRASDVTPKERLAWLPRRYLRLVRKATKAGYLSDRKAAEYVNLDYEKWLSLTSTPRTEPQNGEQPYRSDLEDSEVLVAS